MQSFKKPTKRAAIITGVAGVAVLGAVAVGGAAFADGPAAPSVGASGAAAPSAAPSGAPAAPAAPGQQSGSQAAPATPPTPKPHIGGEVQSVSGSTVTVKDHEGFTRTIVLSSGATVTKDGSAADASSIVQGAHVEATGTVDANGTSLDATEVRIGEPVGPKGGAAGGLGEHGGPGAGPMGGRSSNGQAPTPPSGAPAAPQQQGGSDSQQSAPSPSASAPVQGS